MRQLFADLRESLRSPEFWALSSWLDIVVRYRQSRLGAFWIAAPSAVYIWGLGGAYGSMIGANLASFTAHVALGYVVFRIVSTVVIESTTTFPSAGSFILDGHTRLTDFVLRVLAKALFYFVASLPVVAIALFISPELHWSALPVALMALLWVLVNVLWIAVVFALMGARFPDISQLVGNVFTFAFLLTPVIWHASAMPAGSFRGTLMRFNPLFHMVELVRAPLLGMEVERFSLYYLAVMTVGGWLVAYVAYRRYARYVPIWI